MHSFLKHLTNLSLFGLALLVNLPQPFSFLLFFDALGFGPLALLFQLSFDLLSLDHFPSEICQLNLQALSHPVFGVGVPRDNIIKIFLRHCAFELCIVALISQVPAHLSLEKQNGLQLELVFNARIKLGKLIALPEALNSTNALYHPRVPVPLQLHSNPSLQPIRRSYL